MEKYVFGAANSDLEKFIVNKFGNQTNQMNVLPQINDNNKCKTL